MTDPLEAVEKASNMCSAIIAAVIAGQTSNEAAARYRSSHQWWHEELWAVLWRDVFEQLRGSGSRLPDTPSGP